MEKAVLIASHRSVTGKQVGTLRRAGKLPGVIYGHHMEPTAIVLDLRDATRILHGLSGSALVDIDLDGTKHSALVREKQRDFIRGTLLHVDFQAVSLTEKLRTRVAITMQGIAPAVKDFDGLLVTAMERLEVECLPQDLPESITIDISGLGRIGDSILVKDVVVSDKVILLANPDETIIVVTLSGKVEEEEVVPEVVVAEPEIIERGRKEEEEEEK